MTRAAWFILCCCCVGLLIAGCGRNRAAESTPPATDVAAATQPAPATQASTPQEPTVTPVAAETPVETEAPTATVASEVSPTVTSAATAALTMTAALTPTLSVTPTQGVTATDTITDTITEAITETATPASGEELTPTVTASPAVTAGAEVAAIATMTETVTPTGTLQPTVTATLTATETPTATEVATEEAAAEETASPAATEALTGTDVVTATAAVTRTVTGGEAVRETVTPTATEDLTATAPVTASVTPDATAAATATVTETVTDAVTETVTATATATATITPTPIATATAAATAIPATTALTEALPTRVRITDVRKIYEGDLSQGVESAELSPDGQSIAWLVPALGRQAAQLCVEPVGALETGQSQCVDIPDYLGLPYRLAWSPDSRWIAFSEDPAAQAVESDIWLFNVETGDWANRTDDGVGGAIDGLEPGTYTLDYLPMWHPISGELYFWRSTPIGLEQLGLELMRLDPALDAAPVRVRTLEQKLGTGLIPYGVQRFYLDGPSAISPDGARLAVVTAPSQEMNLSPSNGLWLIDLADADAAPVQVATSLAWQAALPSWWAQPAVAHGLAWTADSAGIVVAALSNDLRLPLLTAYYVDPTVDTAADTATPVVDFSDVPNRAAFFQPAPGSPQPRRYDVPWTVALLGNANVLLLVNDLGGIARISSVALPPTGMPPQVLTERLSQEYAVLTRSSRGEGGKVLVYGLLLTTAAEPQSE